MWNFGGSPYAAVDRSLVLYILDIAFAFFARSFLAEGY